MRCFRNMNQMEELPVDNSHRSSSSKNSSSINISIVTADTKNLSLGLALNDLLLYPLLYDRSKPAEPETLLLTPLDGSRLISSSETRTTRLSRGILG